MGQAMAKLFIIVLSQRLLSTACHIGMMTGSAQPHDFQGNFGNLS